MAERMGIARATLRTGLHRLAGEGIVIQIPYSGWEIPELTAADVRELWTLRGALEGLASKLAAESSSEETTERISDAYDALTLACKKGNQRRIAECDFALHRSIVEATEHSRLEQQYRLVEQQVRLFIVTSNALVHEGPNAIRKQHAPIVESILERDGDRAAKEAWHHNESEGRKLADWLQSRSGDAKLA